MKLEIVRRGLIRADTRTKHLLRLRDHHTIIGEGMVVRELMLARQEPSLHFFRLAAVGDGAFFSFCRFTSSLLYGTCVAFLTPFA